MCDRPNGYMTVQVITGDCRDVLPTLPECSVDAIVTDPPYHLTTNKPGGSGVASLNENSPAGRARIGTGFMGMKWDGGGVAFDPETWREALRVLKPGGHLLAFGGSRTYHRMVCAIEDAGFEIRDQIMWLYGSGFPKSLDVSKAIDREAGAERIVVGKAPWSQPAKSGHHAGLLDPHVQGEGRFTPDVTAPATALAREWDGWGTALKPAHEPIVVARKPLIGTVAANVLAHDTGALNIDGCRIEGRPRTTHADGNHTGAQDSKVAYSPLGEGYKSDAPEGRWPANLIHDGSDEVLAAFPDAPGQLADVSPNAPSPKTSNVYGRMNREGEASADRRYTEVGATNFAALPGARRLDGGSAARFFYCAKASREDRDEGCEAFSKKPLLWSSGEQNPGSFQSPNTDRSARNFHPTVKPTALMRWLVRLVTPPSGLVLDMFAGSGSTGKACELEGFDCILIEGDEQYIPIIQARLAFAREQRETATAQRDLFVEVA